MRNRTGFGATFAAAAWLTAGAALAQTNWTKLNNVSPGAYDWDSPVAWTNDGRIGLGTSGHGDDGGVQPGASVIVDGNNNQQYLWNQGPHPAGRNRPGRQY